MQIKALALAALVAVGASTLASAAADAQPMRGPGYHHGYRHRVRVCRTFFRHGHRVRVCRFR